MSSAHDQGYLSAEAKGGLVLIAATILALVAANSPWASAYQAALDLPMAISAGTLSLSKPLILWVNDGLMALFFLLVELELKAEMLEGRLRDPRAVLMPGLAALGGMVVPALIYLTVTQGTGATAGWAIPAATDIAFALGVLALAGPGLPAGLRSFLLTLAILDDLGAILIIALFYGHDLHMGYLVAALAPVGALLVLARMKAFSLGLAMVLGVILWLLVLKSGIHATVAGVVMAFCIPLKDKAGGSVLHRLTDALQPWVAYFIVPLFALVNAGLPLGNLGLAGNGGQIALGVGLGLVLGKFVGIMGASAALVLLGFGRLPEGMRWPHMAAASLLAGIGFTMSLFIGGLAFAEGDAMNAVRFGVLVASVVAATAGLLVLRNLSGKVDRGAL